MDAQSFARVRAGGIIKWFKEVGFEARGQSMNRERPSKHAFLIIVIYTRGAIGLTSRWTRRSLVDYIPLLPTILSPTFLFAPFLGKVASRR